LPQHGAGPSNSRSHRSTPDVLSIVVGQTRSLLPP
jgi:hypothetical protein